jgi:putative addiction module component (TIGR02574 family)
MLFHGARAADPSREAASPRTLDSALAGDHDPAMATDRVRKLLAEAAALPTDERAELVHELARTLPEAYDGGDDVDVDYVELDRRMESVRDGSAVLVPWEEVRRQLLGE